MASGASHILASIQASRWHWIAAWPEVAAAHSAVASAPTLCTKGPYEKVSPLGFAVALLDISDARIPYALISSGVLGRMPLNSRPSFRAVVCCVPFCASSSRKQMTHWCHWAWFQSPPDHDIYRPYHRSCGVRKSGDNPCAGQLQLRAQPVH